MVIANPMHVVNVSDVPRESAGAFTATRAENCGESGTTVRPQMRINKRNNGRGKCHITGDNKQHIAEKSRAARATGKLPVRIEILPPAQQPKPPMAMTANDRRDPCSIDNSRVLRYRFMIQGVSAQNV